MALDDFRGTQADAFTSTASDEFPGLEIILPPVVESGFAIDVVSIRASVVAEDAGAGSESVGNGLNSVLVEDAAGGLDLVSRGGYDRFANTGADSFVSTFDDEFAPIDFQAKRVEESGSGLDQVSLLSGMSPVIEDSGAGSEEMALAVLVTATDQGIGSDVIPQPGIRVSFSVPDVAMSLEAITRATETSVTIGDGGTAIDDIVVAVLSTIVESGAIAEEFVRDKQIPVAEAGTGQDGITIAAQVPIEEASAASDIVLMPGSNYFSITESITGADVLNVIKGMPSVIETGLGSDVIAVAALIPITETVIAEESVGSYEAESRVTRVEITLSGPRVDITFLDY